MMILPFFTKGQPAHASIKVLEKNHGFKEITVGSDITVLSNKIEPAQNGHETLQGIKYFQVTDTALLKLGKEVKINKILLGVYNQKIAYIHLYLDEQNGDNLLAALKNDYGSGLRPTPKIKRYHWKSSHVMLRFNATTNNGTTVVFADRDLNKTVFASQPKDLYDEHEEEYLTKVP
ncbi:hypothetical protein [Mucilaginibacter lacusdianchii]|uniref:hypothetical protein n=1 Tax=Mucilaginibacter lacusdianchii TaxID=2684211 RepID=UPI00131C8933|nr:hypothetical protein [Mucilaginibacter sp. JXJ CY 39]